MKVEILKATKLSGALAEELYSFYSKTFAIDQDHFRSSLVHYEMVAIQRRGEDIIASQFFDIKAVRTPCSGKSIISIYFGITAIDERFRSSGFVQKCVMKAMGIAYLRHPFQPKYIWCHAATYKPYLFFAKILQKGYPRFNQPPDASAIEIRDTLIANCPVDLGQNGWLSSVPVSWVLEDGSDVTTDRDLQDPHIRYYKSLVTEAGIGLFTYAPADVENLVLYLRKAALKKLTRARAPIGTRELRGQPGGESCARAR